MYIELYTYVEGDEACEVGEYIGYVSLEEDDVYIDVDDDKLAEKLEEMFSEPITVSSGLAADEEIEPYTEEFFQNVVHLLPDIDIRGKLQETEESYVRRTIVNPDEFGDEDIGEMPLDIDSDSITDISVDYDVEDDDEMIPGEDEMEEEDY